MLIIIPRLFPYACTPLLFQNYAQHNPRPNYGLKSHGTQSVVQLRTGSLLSACAYIYSHSKALCAFKRLTKEIHCAIRISTQNASMHLCARCNAPVWYQWRSQVVAKGTNAPLFFWNLSSLDRNLYYTQQSRPQLQLASCLRCVLAFLVTTTIYYST